MGSLPPSCSDQSERFGNEIETARAVRGSIRYLPLRVHHFSAPVTPFFGAVLENDPVAGTVLTLTRQASDRNLGNSLDRIKLL